MKLLLKEDVDNLGSVGELVEVKDGYGRNFLLPQNKAILATPKNVKQYNHQISLVKGRLKKLKDEAQTLAQTISKIELSFTKKVGDQGKLFGSVTSQEIADVLAENGAVIDKRKIQITDPIKQLGDHEISIKLHQEVTLPVKVTVAAQNPEPEEGAENTEDGTEEEEKPADETA